MSKNLLKKRGMSSTSYGTGVSSPTPPKTVARWAKRLLENRTRVINATEDETVGNMIRKNQSAFIDKKGTQYKFAVRMLGASNKALTLNIDGEVMEVFPSTDLEDARAIWLAIFDLIKTDTDIQEQVITQLNESDYQGSASQLNEKLNEEVA